MCLSLQSGLDFKGESFGAIREVNGEVVFNTGMTGYVETLTDPSYRGQILVLTYPLQGNYGVPEGPYESGRIQVQGVVISHYTEFASHHLSVRSLGDWLQREGIPGICGVDTRTLTRHLREKGTIQGDIRVLEHFGPLQSVEVHTDERSVLELVTPDQVTRIGSGSTKILLIDTGSKQNILRCLGARGVHVIRAPWNTPWENYLPEVDGVFLTNGPGDPAQALPLIARVKELLEYDLPVFGICFGHQILALAAGARTYKMQFGNRSVNQPVKDLLSGRCYITSQNHGYVVSAKTLKEEWEPWFINLNDNTNEGIRHRYRPISSVQFHPEASPGPNDTVFLFDDFLRTVRNHKDSKKQAIHETSPLANQLGEMT
jgi:carbamoyl-phosphate synthase small subunit